MPRLYLDPNRAFGGVLNDPDERLAYYRRVLAAAEREADAARVPGPVRVLGAVRVTARYRAPAADGGLLAEPPLDRIASQLDANTARLNAAPTHIAGVPLSEYRVKAVAEVLTAAREYLAEGGEPAPPPAARLLVAGHQPDFFHPGVWVKKFVLHALAARHGAAPLNLVVDNDMVKSAAIRVPVVNDDPAKVTAINLPFDRPKGDRPHEEYHIVDRALFDSFPERLATYTRSWGFEPLVNQIWPMIGSELDRGVTLGTAASRVRRSLERRWGVTNFELPVSRLAETRAFAGFLCTMLGDLPRFVDAYNAAIRDYRSRNRLQSQNHPAPELRRWGDRIEAPFWIWRSDLAKRERLYVRLVGERIELQAGDRPVSQMPIGCSGAVDAWTEMSAAGWKVRPRALTLTLFARLCLADGFIHGIGGGKYDEVTDDIIRRFFQLHPPGYAVVTATLRLPLPRFPATPSSLHAAERRVRDLDWNPQRFVATRNGLAAVAEQKVRLIVQEPVGKESRRRWFRDLQMLTREMRPALASDFDQAERNVNRARAELAANAVVASRDYAWPLFSEEPLRSSLSRL